MDVVVAVRGVCGVDGVATGRAPLTVLGELAGAATGLRTPFGEGRCVGVCVTDPVLGRLSGVDGRLASLHCAGDAVAGTSGLVYLVGAFPDLPSTDVTCSGRGVSTAN